MSDQPIIAEKKPKVFSFSNQELEVLRPRQDLIDQYRILANDLNLFIQQYIVTVVLPRLDIAPDKFDIQFNIRNNNLNCTQKPPEIIKPEDGIILPK